MHTTRVHQPPQLRPTLDARLLEMFDGALPPEPPPAPPPATHEFLVLCLRPVDPSGPRPTRTTYRTAA